MTGRERVRAALAHKQTDRVPRDLWALPFISLFKEQELDEVLAKYPGDIERPELSPGFDSAEISRLSKIGTYTDDWGSVWHVGEPGVIGEVKEPAIDSWTALDHFQPPWELVRERDLSDVNRACDESQLFTLSSICARPFERLQFVRGTENVYMDLAYDTRELHKLIEMIHDFYLKDVASWCTSNVDAVFMMDDWGANASLLIDPKMWRRIFKPLYRQYCDMIHQAGKFAFFHSDGYIEPILGDLIEVGMDAINSQLFCMDIEELGRKYAGRVTFWGEIDRQHVLPFGSKDEVRAAVRRVRNAMGGPGGLIGQCEWGKDNPRSNIESVFESWLEE